MRTALRAGGAAAVAAATTALAGDLFARSTWAGEPPWVRQNYRGSRVSLAGGAAAAAGVLAGAAVGAPPAQRRDLLVAGIAAALAGAYDDLVAVGTELHGDKGWRGHLAAVRAGRVSGGAVKVAVIGAGAVVSVRRPEESWGVTLRRAALVAGSANLLNLFDLRPGRAAKVAVLAGLATCGGPNASGAAVAGAAAAALPADLAERRMLGDLGANTLGAVLGTRLAASSAGVQSASLAVVTALTLASERVSFSRVIDAVPALRALDRWGRIAPAASRPAVSAAS